MTAEVEADAVGDEGGDLGGGTILEATISEVEMILVETLGETKVVTKDHSWLSLEEILTETTRGIWEQEREAIAPTMPTSMVVRPIEILSRAWQMQCKIDLSKGIYENKRANYFDSEERMLSKRYEIQKLIEELEKVNEIEA